MLGFEGKKKKKLYPVLIVDNLPKSFGNIDKNDTDVSKKLSQSEEILLTLIAGIIVETILNDGL